MSKKRKRHANLGAYAQKRTKPSLDEVEVPASPSSPPPMQVIENIPDSDDDLPMESETGTDTSEVSNMSELEDDNDLPAWTGSSSSLFQWLQVKRETAMELIQKAAAQTSALAAKRDGKRGTYATKVNAKEYSLRTKQHHALQERKKAAGCSQITHFFKPKAEVIPEPVNEETIQVPLILQQLSAMRARRVATRDISNHTPAGTSRPPSPPLQYPPSPTPSCCSTPEHDTSALSDELPISQPTTVSHSHPAPTRPGLPFNSPLRATEVDLCITEIDQILRPHRPNGPSYLVPDLNHVLRIRLEFMVIFLRIFQGKEYKDWMVASQEAAAMAGRGAWFARRLREWCKAFAVDKAFRPTHEYGRWNACVLEDEDLATEIKLALQELGNKYISAADVVKVVDTPEMREKLNLKRAITVRTAQRWMKRIGYRWKKEPKGQYSDGHERADVVEYRRNYLKTMATLHPKLQHWNPLAELEVDNLDTILEEIEDPENPDADGELDPEYLTEFEGRRTVLWYHDESTFYAHDRRQLRWVHNSESAVPYAKGEGLSLMVADYMSADYGWLRAPDRSVEAREIFRAGKNRDGWYGNDEILAQASRAMEILEKFFPDDDHVFVYDNARTHQKRAPDALSAQRMPANPSPRNRGRPNFLCLSKGSEDRIQMRNGRFADGTEQELYFPDDHPDHPGMFKGMRQLILERNAKGAGLPDPRRLKAQCANFKCAPHQTTCCCQRILFNQPDFANQPSLLEEQCAARGFKVIFLPKFHCELNPIEQCWGYAKRRYRECPPSSLDADLERNMLKALDGVPLKSMRKFTTRVRRFEDAYRKGLNGKFASWAVKDFRGHRTISTLIKDKRKKK